MPDKHSETRSRIPNKYNERESFVKFLKSSDYDLQSFKGKFNLHYLTYRPLLMNYAMYFTKLIAIISNA